MNEICPTNKGFLVSFYIHVATAAAAAAADNLTHIRSFETYYWALKIILSRALFR